MKFYVALRARMACANTVALGQFDAKYSRMRRVFRVTTAASLSSRMRKVSICPRSIALTPLRQRMLEDTSIRNLAENTKLSYVQQVSSYARHFKRPPEDLGPEQVRAYQVHLIDGRKLAPHSIRIAVSALRFLYKVTPKRDWTPDKIPSGFQRIRSYGFLANCTRKAKLERCRQLLDVPASASSRPDEPEDYRDRYQRLTGVSLRDCPACRNGQMILIETLEPHALPRGPPCPDS